MTGKPGNTIGFALRCVAFLAFATALPAESVATESIADADALFAAGEKSYSEAKWQQAHDQFNTFFQVHSDDPRATTARFYSAEALMQLGQFDAALGRYRDLWEGTPPEQYAVRIRFRVGESAWFAGQPDAARWELQAFVDQYPDDPLFAEATLLLGQALQLEGKHDAALARYHMVIRRYPTSRQMPTALMAAAGLHNHLQQHLEARRLFERFIADFPDHKQLEEAVFQLGWLLTRTESVSQNCAVAGLLTEPHGLTGGPLRRSGIGSKSETQKDSHIRARGPCVLQTETLQTLGDPNRASNQWRRLHTEFPDGDHWYEATYLLAQDAFDRGVLSQAEKLVDSWLQKANRSSPSSELPRQLPGAEMLARIHYLQAQIAAAQKHWTDVIAPLAQLINRLPDSPMRLPAHFWIAEANFRSGKYDRAAQQFEQLALLVAGQEEDWIAMIPLRRAQLLARQGEWTEAYQLVQSSAEKNPGFALQYEADYVLGRCLANRGDMAQARVMYRRVFASDAGSSTETAAMAQWMIGETYMHQRDFAGALPEYLRTLDYTAYPSWQARAALQVGTCYEQMKQWRVAERWYATAAEQYADTDVGNELAARRDRVHKQLQ